MKPQALVKLFNFDCFLKSLLKKMICKNPSMRISAEDALTHPFFNENENVELPNLKSSNLYFDKEFSELNDDELDINEVKLLPQFKKPSMIKNLQFSF